jgi:hypothetical protein
MCHEFAKYAAYSLSARKLEACYSAYSLTQNPP